MPSPRSCKAIAILLATVLLLALEACKSSGLAITAPAPVEVTAGPVVFIAPVDDARVFTTKAMTAPVPSTSANAQDPAWTRRVFGRRRSGTYWLGADLFTADPGGIPTLVREALSAGASRAGLRVVSEAEKSNAAAPHLDAVIEAFWIYEPRVSAMARLNYQAEIIVSGNLEGFDAPARLSVQGSVGSGAADGLLWRKAVQNTLEAISAQVQEAIESRRTGARSSLRQPGGEPKPRYTRSGHT